MTISDLERRRSVQQFVHRVSFCISQEELESELIRWAEKGWELITVCIDGSIGRELYWKRPYYPNSPHYLEDGENDRN